MGGGLVEKVGRREAVAWCLGDVWAQAWYRLAQSQHENICLWVFEKEKTQRMWLFCVRLPEKK